MKLFPEAIGTELECRLRQPLNALIDENLLFLDEISFAAVEMIIRKEMSFMIDQGFDIQSILPFTLELSTGEMTSDVTISKL